MYKYYFLITEYEYTDQYGANSNVCALDKCNDTAAYIL